MKNYSQLNANPAGNDTHDCALRAISQAVGMPYAETAERLGIKLHRWNRVSRGPTADQIQRSFQDCLSPVRRRLDNCRMSLSFFAKTIGPGVYLAMVSDESDENSMGHIVMVKDGKYWDSFDSGKYGVYAYFEVTKPRT